MLSLRSRPGWTGMDRFGDGGLAVHDAEDPLRRGRRPLRGRDHAAHRIQAHVEAADVGQKERQLPTRQLVRDRLARRRRPRRPAGRRRSAARSSGRKTTTARLTRSLACSTRSLARRKRSISRRSWAKALTTRMPGMVSARTLVISAQARLPNWKPLRSRLRTV